MYQSCWNNFVTNLILGEAVQTQLVHSLRIDLLEDVRFLLVRADMMVIFPRGCFTCSYYVCSMLHVYSST